MTRQRSGSSTVGKERRGSSGSRRRATRLRSANRRQRHDSVWLGVTVLACLLLLGVVIGRQVIGTGTDHEQLVPSAASTAGDPGMPDIGQDHEAAPDSPDTTPGEEPETPGPRVPIII